MYRRWWTTQSYETADATQEPGKSTHRGQSSDLLPSVNVQQQFELIGGTSRHSCGAPLNGTKLTQPYSSIVRGSLPPELIDRIILIAAWSLKAEGDRGDDCSPDLKGGSAGEYVSDSITENLLSLAAVNTAAYESVFGRVVLPDLTLWGPAQLEAFCASIGRSRRLRRLASDKIRTLKIAQQQCSRGPHARGQGEHTRQSQRSGLYDTLIQEQKFDKQSCTPLRSYVLPIAQAIEVLHLDTLPSSLLPLDSLTPTGPSQRLREVTFALTTWGGAGLEDVFVGASTGSRSSNSADITPTPPIPAGLQIPSPWERLERIQIHGRAGFRFSLASASALGSLPALKHLGLVMPNFTRDPGMGRHSAVAPAALQLLILLTAGRLETLLVIGHELEGWLGCSSGYRSALKSLRVTSAEQADRRDGVSDRTSVGTRLSILLITARLESGGSCDEQHTADPLSRRLISNGPTARLQHPNFFSSWIVRRAAEGSHWAWDGPEDSPDGARCFAATTRADRQMGVQWMCERWQVPAGEDISEGSSSSAQVSLDERSPHGQVPDFEPSSIVDYRPADIVLSDLDGGFVDLD
ncbi:unnamed protein product [Parajaminaea phylloscopi]